jgi:phage tail tape-measure protein
MSKKTTVARHSEVNASQKKGVHSNPTFRRFHKTRSLAESPVSNRSNAAPPDIESAIVSQLGNEILMWLTRFLQPNSVQREPDSITNNQFMQGKKPAQLLRLLQRQAFQGS